MDRIPTEAFALRAEISRILRCLMGDNPIDAEEHQVDIPELMETDISGMGALEFSVPGGGVEYIVYNQGTKYTTAVRPTHIPDELIKHVTPPAATNQLWIRLQERCQELHEISKDAYQQLGIQNVLDSVAYFYSPRNNPDERPMARYVQALTDFGSPSDLVGDNTVKIWISNCIDRLLQRYSSFLLAGDEVKQAYATLTFFQLCPFPLTSLIHMTQEFFQYRFGGSLGGKPVVMAFPMMDINFYLNHPQIAPDLAVVWGTGAARTLQDKGNEIRDRAKQQYSLEQFCFYLYAALLCYRCALYLYSAVLLSPKSTVVKREKAKDRIDKAKVEANLCEEHRVLIMTSLTSILGLRQTGLPSFANVSHLHSWVGYLAANSANNAEIHIRQAYDSELAMPRFLRDLALGFLKCLQREPKRGLCSMLTVMEALEKHLDEAVILGDPNYLSSTYDLMAQIAANSGMASESAEYRRRSEPPYYQNLLKRQEAASRNL